MSKRVSVEEFRELTQGGALRAREVRPGPELTGRRNKFGVAAREKREYRGRVYASKAEMEFAAKLDRLHDLGEVHHWHPQVVFLLPGGVKAVVDFLVFYSSGGHVYYDVKGQRTQQWKRNKKMIKELFGVEVVEVEVRSKK